jgi:hypothetical protein
LYFFNKNRRERERGRERFGRKMVWRREMGIEDGVIFKNWIFFLKNKKKRGQQGVPCLSLLGGEIGVETV